MSTLVDGRRVELMDIDQVEVRFKALRLKLRAAELRFADQLEATKALRVKLQEAERELEQQRPVMAAVAHWQDSNDCEALLKVTMAFRRMR